MEKNNTTRCDATQGVDSPQVTQTKEQKIGKFYSFTDVTTLSKSSFNELKATLAKGFEVYVPVAYDELTPYYEGIEEAFRKHVYSKGVEDFQYLPTQLIATKGGWVVKDREENIVDEWETGNNLRLVSTQINLFGHLEKCEYETRENVENATCPKDIIRHNNFILMYELDGYYVFSTPTDTDIYYSDDGFNCSQEFMVALAVKKEAWEGYIETLNNKK